jgi:hypothetical protein
MSRVKLSEIESVSRSDLNSKRLDTLLNGFNTFDKVLESAGDPIALSGKSAPYTIIDGRHRIYLAREKGYSSVNVRFV